MRAAREGDTEQAERARDRHAPNATIYSKGEGGGGGRKETESKKKGGEESGEMHRAKRKRERERERAASFLQQPFSFTNMFAIEFMRGEVERAGRACIRVAGARERERDASCKVHSGPLPDCTGRAGGPGLPLFSPTPPRGECVHACIVQPARDLGC